MNNNTQESKIQLEYINKCTELVKEKYEKAPAFFIQNAGCQMNSLQTDTVAGIVKRMGYTEVSREEDADVVIYNTCTVRENANLKVIFCSSCKDTFFSAGLWICFRVPCVEWDIPAFQ